MPQADEGIYLNCKQCRITVDVMLVDGKMAVVYNKDNYLLSFDIILFIIISLRIYQEVF